MAATFTTAGKANVIQQPGSVVNVSAGYVQYTGGIINTTRVLGANGRIYDIGSADPTALHLAVASGFHGAAQDQRHRRPRRSTQVYLSPLGSRGGTTSPATSPAPTPAPVNVTAIAPILASEIVADVTAGNRQRAGLIRCHRRLAGHHLHGVWWWSQRL